MQTRAVIVSAVLLLGVGARPVPREASLLQDTEQDGEACLNALQVKASASAPQTAHALQGSAAAVPGPPRDLRRTPYPGILPFVVQKCTLSGGCTDQHNFLTLASDYRWTYNATNQSNQGCSNCTGDACSVCTIDTNIDYEGLGIITSADQKTLTLKNGARLYMLDSTGSSYEELDLLNKEFSWDVDMSQMPCGMNSAMYTVEMPSDGGYTVPMPGADVGASAGTGYCDAQCPSSGVGGNRVNLCCAEMDLWEANRVTHATTTHGCPFNGTHICTGRECDSKTWWGLCDGGGCDFNAYRNGEPDFYGNRSDVTGVNSSRPFGVTIQFITDESNILTEVRNIYRQDGRIIKQKTVQINGEEFDSITNKYCETELDAYKYTTFNLEPGQNPECNTLPVGTETYNRGGKLASVGESLGRGHVLVLSLWNDASCNMLWLDGKFGYGPGSVRGPCGFLDQSGPFADGNTAEPIVEVTFSNIRWGEIGSTRM